MVLMLPGFCWAWAGPFCDTKKGMFHVKHPLLPSKPLKLLYSAASAPSRLAFFTYPSRADKAPLKIEKNTVRTVRKLSITKKNDLIFIEIEANGFLYKMVRNIVGTLVDVGNGRLPPGSITAILKKKNRIYASETAPAQGLFLVEVGYK